MFRIGLCQMKGSFDKTESMKTAERFVREAAENGAEIISLPEMWNCPYSNDYFREYSEPADGSRVPVKTCIGSGYISGGRFDT